MHLLFLKLPTGLLNTAVSALHDQHFVLHKKMIFALLRSAHNKGCELDSSTVKFGIAMSPAPDQNTVENNTFSNML